MISMRIFPYDLLLIVSILYMWLMDMYIHAYLLMVPVVVYSIKCALPCGGLVVVPPVAIHRAT